MVFDPLAPSYDADFTDHAIARYLRGVVHERLARHFQSGDYVLELGCGTGEDALALARRGIRVLATDSSAAMLESARAKSAGETLVTFAEFDLANAADAMNRVPTDALFNGVFSNFGPLNCLTDWRPLAGWLAGRIKPGGIAAFGVMSPLCVWEPLWHGMHGNFKIAARRWSARAQFQTAQGTISIAYPTIHRLTRDFSPWFRRTHVRGLGLFLPPSDVYGAVERRSRLLNTLMSLERRFAPLPALASFADHYWIEFTRREDR